MKKYFHPLFCLLNLFSASAQYVVIPDVNFLSQIALYAPTAVSGNMIDTTNATLTSIQVLQINSANISDLTGIEYFDALLTLECIDNQVTAIPSALPPLISSLDFSQNPVAYVYSLPQTLSAFSCTDCAITGIDSLPNSLVHLIVPGNQLANLPPLPPNLFTLECSDNFIDSLPTLPNTLQFLGCKYNPIQCLPTLPNSMTELRVMGTNVTCIPNLPPVFITDVTILICDSTNSSCPFVPSAISEEENLFSAELFPNPTEKLFTVKCNSSKEISLMEIVNALGDIIYSQQLSGEVEHTIDVPLAKGFYFVQFINDSGQFFSKKLIVD